MRLTDSVCVLQTSRVCWIRSGSIPTQFHLASRFVRSYLSCFEIGFASFWDVCASHGRTFHFNVVGKSKPQMSLVGGQELHKTSLGCSLPPSCYLPQKVAGPRYALEASLVTPDGLFEANIVKGEWLYLPTHTHWPSGLARGRVVGE